MKLLKTLKIAFTLVLARTFGKYIHSGWDGLSEYALYEWRGQEWAFPLGPSERRVKIRKAATLASNTPA